MRFIPTRIHGVLDYLAGLAMLATPFLLDIQGVPRLVLLVIGAGAILYAVFTDYELGIWRKLRMPAHLSLDVLGGMALAASPFALGFGNEVWIPHVAFGAFSIFAGAFTQTAPSFADPEMLRV